MYIYIYISISFFLLLVPFKPLANAPIESEKTRNEERNAAELYALYVGMKLTHIKDKNSRHQRWDTREETVWRRRRRNERPANLVSPYVHQ